MSEIQSVNHSAICVHDLQQAVDFYCGVLGAREASATDFVTEDVIKGRSLHRSVILEDYLIALMLARDFMPMPPDEQLHGTHGFRHAFGVPRNRFKTLISILDQNGVRYEGPVMHRPNGPFGESIYVKDPSGNFLEFVWRRDENVGYDRVDGVGEG
jgi:extradiol dioxygenase family protein